MERMITLSVQYTLLMQFFGLFICHIRKDKKWILAIGIPILWGVDFVFRIYPEFTESIIAQILCIIIGFSTMMSFYQGSAAKRIVCILILDVLGAVVYFCTYYTINFLPFIETNQEFYEKILIGCMDVFLVFLFPHLYDKFEKVRNWEIKRKWMVYLLITMMFITRIWGKVLPAAYYEFGDGYYLPTALLFMCVVGVIGAFMLNYQKKQRLLKENEYLEISGRLMQEHYGILTRQIRQTNRYQQELQSQFETASVAQEGQIDSQKLLEFRHRLLELSRELNKVDYCKDPVLNAVLYNKIEECKENGILVNLQLNNFTSGSIDDLTKIMLFYWIFSFYKNLELALSAHQEKRIGIKCENYAGYLVILCSGTYPKEGNDRVYKKQNTPELKNLQKSVQEYDGAMEVKEEENKMILALSFRAQQ